MALAIAGDLAGTSTPEEVVHALLRRAVDRAGADRGTLCRVDGGDLIVEATYEVPDSTRWMRLRYPLRDYPAAEAVVRSRHPSVTGTPDRELLPPPLAEALADVRHAVMLPLTFNDEVVALLLVCRNASAGFDEDELATVRVVGTTAMLVLRNITLLQSAREEARAKSAFLSMVAHELRSPLGVIAGYISLLEDGAFGQMPDGSGDALAKCAEKTAELSRMIEDILAAARMEAGDGKAQRQLMDLRDAVLNAVRRARGRADLLTAEVAAEVEEQPVLVRADPAQIASILDNLVNNSLSYSDGAPWVRLSLCRRGGDAVVAVADRGVGIADDKRDLVFERFQRLEQTFRDHRPGTGLGLPIARGMAKENGGDLVLRSSAPGQGSVFELRLPLNAEQPAGSGRAMASRPA